MTGANPFVLSSNQIHWSSSARYLCHVYIHMYCKLKEATSHETTTDILNFDVDNISSLSNV